MGGKKDKNKKVLFNDDDKEEDISKIEINMEFAQRYLHNKRREDLHRLEELKKKGAISSGFNSDSESKGSLSSSTDNSGDSDDDLNLVKSSSAKQHKQFFDALLKVKKQDPILKQDKDIELFQDDNDDQNEQKELPAESNKKKDPTSLYLKDVLAKQLIEEGPDFNDEEISSTIFKKTYAEEQEDLRKDFLNAAAESQAHNDEDFFSLKNKTNATDDVDSENKEFHDKLDEFFGKDDQLDDNSRFLKEFFMNKLWLDNKIANNATPLQEEEDLSEDEREVERQEEYEYRFQENAGDRVLGHSRKIEGSVRNKKNARKEQRERKHERVDMEAKARKQELKHLKNLKKQEMQEKLKKIIKTAGICQDDLIPLTAAEIDDEFNPEEYDKMMKKAFDEKYYNAEDADPGFCSDNDNDDELRKPDFEEEDELLGLPNGWHDVESGGGFSSLSERNLDQEDDKHADIGENVPHEEGKRKRKHKVALLEKAKEAMMDEYYKLDYEDTIGDLKTRFRYAKIKPNRYGMTPMDILLLDDKNLSQYVSLKKIAPYREKEWKLSNQKRYELKMAVKKHLHDWKSISDDKKVVNKLRHNTSKLIPSSNSGIDDNSQSNEANGDLVSTSKKGRGKKRAVLTQLPLARLQAYGKMPFKSKVNKKKQQ